MGFSRTVTPSVGICGCLFPHYYAEKYHLAHSGFRILFRIAPFNRDGTG